MYNFGVVNYKWYNCGIIIKSGIVISRYYLPLLDSNQYMRGPKPHALPFGEGAILIFKNIILHNSEYIKTCAHNMENSVGKKFGEQYRKNILRKNLTCGNNKRKIGA